MFAPNAQKGSKGIALLLRDLSTRSGGCSAPRPGHLTPGKPRYPLYIGLGGPRAGLDVCEKSHLHQDSIPGPSGP
jgi:hypothetical protein